MPRNISFALTTDQVRSRTKTVTRRLGWKDLKPGTLLQPVVKAQGIPKGGTVEKIGGLIRVTDVRRESLGISHDDCAREGFPGWLPSEFLAMFVRHNGCEPDTVVTRIEFEYLL
jgi:hypothetical protein